MTSNQNITTQHPLLDQTTGKFLTQAELIRFPLLEISIGAGRQNFGL